MTWLLWILFLACILVNEVSYINTFPTKNTESDVPIHTIAGYSGPLSIMGGTARYVSYQEGLIDNFFTYAGIVLIILISIRAWVTRKSKAPILFFPKDSNRKN